MRASSPRTDTSASIVADGSHATGDERDFRASAQARGKRPGEEQRRHRVQLELQAHLVQVDVLERVGQQRAGVLDEQADVVAGERRCELRPRRRLGHADPVDDAHAERGEPGRALATYGDHARAARRELPDQLEPDAAIGAGDDSDIHGGPPLRT
jgi:hypothetical protein